MMEQCKENETMKNYKIAVAGTGYVGLSIATLLSQHHQVTAVDIVPEKVELINNRKSPIQDDYIEKYLAEKELNLTATLDAKTAYTDADFVVIAAPTNYDSHTQHFDTSAVEAVIKLVMEYNPNAIMVIKSTIPVGYTASVREKFNSKNIIFQYLGLNGLFTSILQVLNLAELGVGSAMVYSMYKPIAEDNETKICALMGLYKKYYTMIGFVIALGGSILTPFIPYLIKSDMPADLNVYILYLLNLAATVLSCCGN